MLFIKPIFVSKIWGGQKLQNSFFPNANIDKLGEAWLISCMKGFESIIYKGDFKNETLNNVWKKHPELFNNIKGINEFPLLLKLIDATADLSVQLHPNDKYAKEKLNQPYGKSECWYVVDCEHKQKLILGHNGKNLKTTKEMILNKQWNKFIRKINIKPGEVFDINPGTVHAICGGTVIFELQQASDTTFRLYDYDRLENGKPRQLHIEESLEIIDAPQKFKKNKIISKIRINKEAILKLIVQNNYFKLFELDLNLTIIDIWEYFKESDFLLVTCISGHCTIMDENIDKGESIIITYEDIKKGTINIKGTSKLLISTI